MHNANAQNVYNDAAAAVKKANKEIDKSFTKNVAVIFDGTWHTRGYRSHIGIGSVIEYHTGLILDAVVLSNFCLGCQTGLKAEDEGYQEWKGTHECQKNTDVKSGRIEVEEALILFGRSLDVHDLRYTTIISDGDSKTFLALTAAEAYGFIPIGKEECLNLVQKRMGTALWNLVEKAEWAAIWRKGSPHQGPNRQAHQLLWMGYQDQRHRSGGHAAQHHGDVLSCHFNQR